MIRLSKVMLGTATALAAMTATAMAQTPAGDATTTTDPNAGGGATDPNAASTPNVTATTTPGASADWPTEIIDRPLTLNKGMIGADASLGVAHLDLGMLGSTTSEGLAVAGDYGVSDKIQVGASYGLTLNSFEAKGPFDVHALYRLAHGKLKAAAEAHFGYDLNSQNGDITLGAQVQYNVAPKFAVYTGGDQLDLGIIRNMGSSPITLAIPVGVEAQATPNVFAFAATQLANFSLSNSSTVYISDITPLTVGAFYSPSNKMDFGIAANFFDLQNASTIWAITATARIFKM
jgi:hypothetical protein